MNIQHWFDLNVRIKRSCARDINLSQNATTDQSESSYSSHFYAHWRLFDYLLSRSVQCSMPLEIIKARIKGQIRKSDSCLIFAIHQLVAVLCNECILDVSVWRCAIWCGSLRHSVSLCKKLPVIHTNTLHKSWFGNLRRLEMVWCCWLVQFIYSFKKYPH